MGREIPTSALKETWAHACLIEDLPTLREIRARYLAMWNSLPDDRFRECGNGRRLWAFLDQTAHLGDLGLLSDQEASQLLWVVLPEPRPGQ